MTGAVDWGVPIPEEAKAAAKLAGARINEGRRKNQRTEQSLDGDIYAKAVTQLAKLKPFEYDRLREEKSKELKVRSATLDSDVKKARASNDTTEQSIVTDVEPYDGAVILADLLEEIREVFNRHAILPPYADVVLALWCVFTWFIKAAQIAPLLLIRAAESNCGKTSVKDILELFVKRALANEGITLAALFRVVEQVQPTLLMDDADSWLLRDPKDERHSLINSGHKRGGKVIRCKPDTFELQTFSTFCAKAIIFIGKSKDTLHNRSIEILLRRKTFDECITPLRNVEKVPYELIRQKLARIEIDKTDAFVNANPVIPAGLENRAADNWQPLLAVAEIAGGRWPDLAQQAALEISNATVPLQSISNELLCSIKKIFEKNEADKITTTELIGELCKDSEAPWITFNHGKEISARKISRLLSDYEIRSKNIRINNYEVAKGFELSQFQDAFSRYVSEHSANYPLHRYKSLKPSNSNGFDVADTEIPKVTENQNATTKPAPPLECSVVADKKPNAPDTHTKPTKMRL
jgi:putative DNA primase/helicase